MAGKTIRRSGGILITRGRPLKVCSKCKATKPLGAFYKAKRNSDGLCGQCKDCMKAYCRSEAGRAAQKRHAQTERFKERQRAYLLSDKGKAKQRRYVQSNKGRKSTAEHGKRRDAKYPEKRKAVNAARSIESQPCRVCANPNSEKHHPNYLRPLEVVFLCQKHHRQEHYNYKG